MFKLKNRHWWNMGQKYHRIDYIVKVALGAADLRFELWHNGMKLSKDNPIKVEWNTALPPEPQALNRFNSLGEQWQSVENGGMAYRQTYLPQPQPQIAVANNWGSGEQWQPVEKGGMAYRQTYLPQPQIGVGQNWGGNAFG